MSRDAVIQGYPLPIDPISGLGWWRFNLCLCFFSTEWSAWQSSRRIDDIIPVLRWIIHGSVIPGGPA
jgi:hypothetical protein